MATRVTFRAAAEALRLRAPLHGSEASADLTIHQPLNSSFTLRVGLASDARETRTGGRELIETRRSEAVAAGLEFVRPLGAFGRARVVALAGWDGGAGGEGRLSLDGEHHALDVRGWRVHARKSTVWFPADSLRDVGVSQLASGVRATVSADVTLGPLTFIPRGRWERELLDQASGEPDDGFLLTSPTGEALTREARFGVTAESWGMEATYLSRGVELESTLYRSDLAAGRLFYATLDLSRWTVELSRASAASRWSLTLGREHASGELATRVETWPFVSLWSSLSAQAYRLQGRLDATSTWVRVRRAPMSTTGWSWSSSVGEYDVVVGRDSWFVSSFGFARTGRESTEEGVDPAILVGVEVGRALRMGSALLRVDGEAGLPVSARGLEGTGSRGEGGLAGYAGLAVSWSW